MEKGLVFDIQKFSINNGPGIRTTAFLKGCPLRCLWCHNPESFSGRPQLMFKEKLCRLCGECARACGSGAVRVDGNGRSYDASKCTACGGCCDACVFDAVSMCGREYTSAELCGILLEDKAFYDDSGGGITLSGGEPAMQPEFCMEVLDAMRASGVHTALDTSGFCREDVFRRVVASADLVLFDIKHMDARAHKRLTGVDNGVILRNLEWLAGEGKPLTVRYPLIPGLNDREEDIAALACYLSGLGIGEIEVSVFHNWGENKYTQLCAEPAENIRPYSDWERAEKLKLFEKNKIKYKLA